MNQIAEKQNQPENLQRLAAQRQLYRDGKVWMAALLVIPLVLTLASNLAYLFPAGSAFPATYALIGILFTLAEFLVFSYVTSKSREEAAKIQELFDCDVLELPWNDVLGDKPEPDSVHRAAQRYQRGQTGDAVQTLRNWYDAPLPDPAMPLGQARALAQKQNITWDTDQRRSYARSLLIALGVYGVVLLVVGILANWGVRQFFEGPAIFALTVLVVGGKHYMDHTKAADELDQLKSHLTVLIHEANNAPESTALTAKARDLQTEIFHHRKEHPPIFDWYYNRVKKEKESVARPASA